MSRTEIIRDDNTVQREETHPQDLAVGREGTQLPSHQEEDKGEEIHPAHPEEIPRLEEEETTQVETHPGAPEAEEEGEGTILTPIPATRTMKTIGGDTGETDQRKPNETIKGPGEEGISLKRTEQVSMPPCSDLGTQIPSETQITPTIRGWPQAAQLLMIRTSGTPSCQ